MIYHPKTATVPMTQRQWKPSSEFPLRAFPFPGGAGFRGNPSEEISIKTCFGRVEHCFVLLDVFFVDSVVDCFSVPLSSCPLDMCDQ